MALPPTPAGAPAGSDTLVQFVVLRKDLRTELGWPTARSRPLPASLPTWALSEAPPGAAQGAVVAQACHAATAALWLHRDHPDTAAYCAPSALDAMHKARLRCCCCWLSLLPCVPSQLLRH